MRVVEISFYSPHPRPLPKGARELLFPMRCLEAALERALEGERQVVFVTGEVGIGKTTLVEAFMAQVDANGALWIGRGQCIEQYGAGEAYMPVLEALGRLCREPGGDRLIELLEQHAPTWLVQMPALLSATELEALQRKVIGTTKERMLREMAEAVEVVTAQRPLVLTLEDLHWSDHSTVELLSVLARRQEHARLLVLGTYRPVDVILREHPLKEVKQELALHRQCEELPLAYLTETAVGEYLAGRLSLRAPHAAPFQKLARIIYQRTDGNPLFMVNAVDYAVDYAVGQGLVVQTEGGWELKGKEADIQVGVPETLRQMVEQQIEQLRPAERRVLEVASVAGAEFSAAAVAAGMEKEAIAIEEQCDELVRQGHFIQAEGIQEWPDGTLASQYRFVHALYQEVLYERVAAAGRVQLHRLIGAREERGYGKQASEIAAELAMHFERGRDARRAVQYLGQAGENAARKSAHQAAIAHLTKGLELLKTLPDTPERARQELPLQLALGSPLIATTGYTTLETRAAFSRARELCQQVGETPQLFAALSGLGSFYLVRAEYQTARELAEQLLGLAQDAQNPTLLMAARLGMGTILVLLREFVSALEHLQQGLALYDPEQHNPFAAQAATDPRVSGVAFATSTLWYLGYPDQALEMSQEALSSAEELSHAFSLAWALNTTAISHKFRREGALAQKQAEAEIAISTERGFPQWIGMGTIHRGWALAEQGQGEAGIPLIRAGLAGYRATGARLQQTDFLRELAESYGKAGQPDEGLSVLAEALEAINTTGEYLCEAEVYRLKGELTLEQFKVQGSKSKVSAPEAEACFQKALDVARQQQAKSWELRAATSLARLWQQQGKTTEAHDLLAPVYNWFTEGFDTKDLQDAKTLLEELS